MPVVYDTDGKALSRFDDFAMPRAISFAGIIKGAHDTYWHEKWDEAMKDSRENALMMRHDCWLKALCDERARGTTGSKWELQVDNPADKYQIQVRDGLKKGVERLPYRKRFLRKLLEAHWFGCYANQVKWCWDVIDGERILRVKAHTPVNGDKIGFQFNGTPYVLINAGEEGQLGKGAEVITTTIYQGVLLKGGWRDRWIIHKHDPDDADFFEEDQAVSATHGVGIRSRIYWLDYLRKEYSSWVVDSLERSGLGIVMIKYDQSNEQARAQAETLAKTYSRRAVITVPVPPGQLQSRTAGGAYGIEVVETPTAGIEVLNELEKRIEDKIERYILAQSASSRSETSGMGTHDTDFQQGTKHELIVEDAEELAETLTGSPEEPGLLSTMKRWSYPWADFPVRWVFKVADPSPEKGLEGAKTIVAMGGKLKADEVRELGGFAKPAPEDETIGGQQPGAEAPAAPGSNGPAIVPGPTGAPMAANGPHNRIAALAAAAANGNGHAAEPLRHAWNESEHPRGQPENAGEFGPGGGGGKAATAETAPKATTAAPAQLAGTKTVPVNKPNPLVPDAARPELDDAEKHALFRYSGPDKPGGRGLDEPINKALRSGNPPNFDGKPKSLAAHQAIQKALAKAKPLEKPIAVIRGLELPRANLAGFLSRVQQAAQGGQHLQFAGYSSSTTNPKTELVAGANVILEIEARHGLDMRETSWAPNEDEFLMDHNSQFEIAGVSKEGPPYRIKLRQIYPPNRSAKAVEPFRNSLHFSREPEEAATSEQSESGYNRFVDDGDAHISIIQPAAPQQHARDGKPHRYTFTEDEHPRGQPENAGEFAPKGQAVPASGATAPAGPQTPTGQPAAQTPRQQWEAETKRLEDEHTAAVAAHEQAHAEWDAKVDELDARLKEMIATDYAHEAGQQIERTAAPTISYGEVGPNANDSNITSPEGRQRYTQAVAQHVSGEVSAWDTAYGEGGSYLEDSLRDIGADNDDLAKIRIVAAKGKEAIGKTGQKYADAAAKHMALMQQIDDHKAAEPQEPVEPNAEEPEEPEAPDDYHEEPTDPAEHAAWAQTAAAYDAAYAEYETAHDQWEETDTTYVKAHDKWEAVHDKWDDQGSALEEKADAAAERVGEAEEKMDEVWDDWEEKIGDVVTKTTDRMYERFESERDNLEEPEEPEEPDYPDEPEEEEGDEEDEDDEPDEPEQLYRPGRPLRYESHHAPKGGINLGGRQYIGGEFIPGDVVARASPEEKEQLTRKRSLTEHAKSIVTGEALKDAAAGIIKAMKNPVATAGKARQAAQDKLKSIYAKYGPLGAAAVAGAYVAYYATAFANPVMFTVPVPLTATILTCAEVVRKGVEKLKGKGGEPERNEWNAADHPRGQPDNAGQFGPGGAKAQRGESPTLKRQPQAAGHTPPRQEVTTAKKAKKFGKSKAPVSVQVGADPKKTEALLADAKLKTEDVASVVGAPDDARVKIGADADGKFLWVFVSHPQFEAKRQIRRDEAGKLFVQNHHIEIKGKGQGLGSEIFGRQVEWAKENGISYIQAHAAKASTNNPSYYNGYYTWPRLGYDMSFDDMDAEAADAADRAVVAKLRQKYPDAESIQDVMKTAEGREWWKANGGELYAAKFDLTDGSRSMQIHDAYLAEREQRSKANA